jgi:DNA-directed RNA polymerase specialized sigma24 family protein
MQDRELVAAIVAGDPDGLAEAYDRHAAPLYTYCRLMLPDPDPLGGAALAVQDTFIIAAARLQRLRDPDQLRPWLHAVARNECLRRAGSAESQGNGSDIARSAGRPDPDGATPAVTLPPGLRAQVLKACADDTPAGRAYRVSVMHQAGSFGRTGFPKPVVPPGPAWWQKIRRRRRAAAAVAAVAGAVLVVGIVTLLIGGGSHPAKVTTVALGGGVSPAPSAQAPGSAPAASSPGRKTVAVKGTTTSSVLADTPTTSQGTTPGQSRPSTSAPSSGSPSPSPSPSPSSSPSSSPAQGQLTAAPTKLVLSAIKGQAARGTFTLTAVGGPVSYYAIGIPSSMVGKVSVSPSAGWLGQAGDKVVVTVTVKSLVALDTRLTVEPSGQVITVMFSIKV